jgi:hypothetical protein
MMGVRPAWLLAAAAAFLTVTAGDGSAAPPNVPRSIDPRVDCAVEVLRKTRQGYMVTPTALIPFAIEVRAGHALQLVAYVVTVARLEAGGKVGREGEEHTIPVGGFTQLLRQRHVREFHAEADNAASALDLNKLPQLFREAGDQPPSRYRLRVRLEATDNDNTNGPHTGRSEPVTFVVVPELELLSEVGKEEELLQLNFEDRVADRLRRARLDLQKLNDRLATATADRLPDLYHLADDAATAVTRASERAEDVRTDFRRILRELRANRVRADRINRLEKTICAPLDESLRREFPRSAEALAALTKGLEGTDADEVRKLGARAGVQLDSLVGRIDKVVESTKELADFNKQLRMLLTTQQEIDRLLWDRR